MNSEKIGYIEAIALIAVVMINKIVLNTPREIIASTGSSAWINVIYISVISIFISWLIATLFKKFQDKDILDVSEFLGGKTLKIIIGSLYFISLILVPTFVVKNFAETLKLIYYRTSPLIYVLLFFIIASLIANMFSSLKTLAKVNLLVIPAVLASIVIILFSSARNFVPERIFPLLGYGANETFLSGLSNLFSFSGIAYLLLLNPLIDKPSNLKKISIISIIISAVYLFLSVTCILLSLSFTFKSGEPLSLYSLTRNLEYGRFIQRVDAIFILIWLLSTLSYVSIALFFCINIFKKLTNISSSKYLNYSIHLLVLALLLIPVNYTNYNNKIGSIIKILATVLIFGISLLILIFANVKLKVKQSS